MSSITERICPAQATGALLCLLLFIGLPGTAHSGAVGRTPHWSVSANVNHFFSPLQVTNRSLESNDYPRVTRRAPQLGVELARYKLDLGGRLTRSLSFLYLFWQAKGESRRDKVRISFHEFRARVRVYLMPHLAVPPFLGGGFGFETARLRINTSETDHGGAVFTGLGGFEWRTRPPGAILRLEGGYRWMPHSSIWRESKIKMDTSGWFAGLYLGIRL